MKKKLSLFCALILGATMFNAQVGINTESPTNTFHVKNTAGVDPVRVEGLRPGSGTIVVVDNDGVLKTSTSKINLPFVLPPVSNTAGITLSLASQTGSAKYTEGSSSTGSIPGGGSWTKIPGMEITFDIIEASNGISLSVEGMAQYNGNMAPAAAISFAVGIFVDDKLVAVRYFTLHGSNFNNEAMKFEILGQLSDLSVGSHKVEVYATRRSTLPLSGADSPTAGLSVGSPGPTADNLNNFMAKVVLQVSGVYN